MVSDTRAAARVDNAREPSRFVLLVVAAGVVLGVVSQRADDWSGWTGWLMSMFCVWLLACLVTGRLAGSMRSAGIGTAAMLVAAVLGYYVMFFIRGGFPSTLIALWLILAALTGPPVGAMARATAMTDWPGWASVAGFAGFFLGEGLYGLFNRESPDRIPAVVLDICLGIALPLLMRSHQRDRLRCYALMPAVVAVVMGLLWLLPVVVGILPE